MAAIQQERRSIDDLNPAEYNPRKRLQPGDEEYERLKTSIETFGYVDPIIINADGTVIGGHQRLFVLRDLGYSEADVAVVDLSKADEKALNIALNKISGEWDEEKLAEIFAELDAEGYDLSLTGFGEDELSGLLSVTDADFVDMEKADENVPEPADEPYSRPGDIWHLGNHRRPHLRNGTQLRLSRKRSAAEHDEPLPGTAVRERLPTRVGCRGADLLAAGHGRRGAAAQGEGVCIRRRFAARHLLVFRAPR